MTDQTLFLKEVEFKDMRPDLKKKIDNTVFFEFQKLFQCSYLKITDKCKCWTLDIRS